MTIGDLLTKVIEFSIQASIAAFQGDDEKVAQILEESKESKEALISRLEALQKAHETLHRVEMHLVNNDPDTALKIIQGYDHWLRSRA